MVEPDSSNFRVIETNFLGVRIFRKFTVMSLNSEKELKNVICIKMHISVWSAIWDEVQEIVLSLK